MHLQNFGSYMLKCLDYFKYIAKNINLQVVILFLYKVNRKSSVSWT